MGSQPSLCHLHRSHGPHSLLPSGDYFLLPPQGFLALSQASEPFCTLV